MYLRPSARLALTLILVLMLSACGTGSGQPSSGVLVFTTPYVLEEKVQKLFVARPDGDVVHELSFPSIGSVWELGTSGHVIFEADGAIQLLDTDSGSVKALDVTFDEEERALLFPLASGARWALLPNAEETRSYLLNIQEGRLAELSELLPGVSRIKAASFSADESYLLLHTDPGLWLLPTADVQRARQLSAEQAAQGTFAPDGKSLVYTTRGQSGVEARLESLDGSSTRTIATDPSLLAAVFWPDGLSVALIRPGVVAMHQLSDGKERELLRYEGESGLLYPSATGKSALFTARRAPEQPPTPYWIDVEQGEALSLSTLESAWLMVYPEQRRWIYFSNTQPLQPLGPAGLLIYSFDLETGKAQQVFSNTESSRLMGLPAVNADGSFTSLLVMSKNKEQQAWLLDSGGSEPRLLASAEHVSSAFSPDGRSLVLSTSTREGERRILVAETAGDSQRVVGNGWSASWVRQEVER